MKKVFQVFLLIALLGGSATFGHILYEVALKEGCYQTLKYEYGLTAEGFNQVKDQANSYCTKALDKADDN